MIKKIIRKLGSEFNNLEAAGLFKKEFVATNPLGPEMTLPGGREVVSFCTNDYLGLAQHPFLMAAAFGALNEVGFSPGSTRLLLGTQPIHQTLEKELAQFLGKESAMVFGSDYDANAAIFEALLTHQDKIFFDTFCHASIIDGIRLCKANRVRYRINDLDDLERHLKMSAKSRFRLIVTDGVYSSDGNAARLPEICALAEQFNAIVMVNDAQGTGVMGKTGRGTHEQGEVMEKVDILTGSFGNALGGMNGGFVAGPEEVILWLKQKARPYVMANALSPITASVVLKALDLLKTDPTPLTTLRERRAYFVQGLVRMGLTSRSNSEHPIVGVGTGNAVKTQKMANYLLQQGLFVTGLCYPSVPKNEARVRFQISAKHTPEHLDKALNALEQGRWGEDISPAEP